MANYEWKSDLVIVIDGEEINLETKGVEYAKQFGGLTSWIGRYALPALMTAAESGEMDGSELDVATKLLSGIMELGFSPESMLELSSILLNKDIDYVSEHFDPGWFVEALLRSYDYRPGIKKAFVGMYERFFLARRIDEGDQEDQAQD